MADNRDERALEIAAFRYRLIAEALELSSDEAVSAVLMAGIGLATGGEAVARLVIFDPGSFRFRNPKLY